MIAADQDRAGAPLLRTERRVEVVHGTVTRAALAVTALGIVECYVGGRAVSDEVLTPGWSAYEWRLRYRTHDVTQLVREAGAHLVLGLALGRGWACGRLGYTGGRAFYAQEPSAIAELCIEFADGHVQTIVTDASWQAGPSCVTANDLYDGQSIDARLRDDSWLSPGAMLNDWGGVHPVEFDSSRLVAYRSPVVRRQETLGPLAIWTSGSGSTLVDFGQNLVGWVRLRARGEPGSVITVRHAEVLDHGELGVRPLRSALATDRFVLSGADDTFEPTFTAHGFRYAQVDGFPGILQADDLEAVVVHTDLDRIGAFECSDPAVTRLHENVVWSLKGNVLDVPTDCPQRDERLGWTGDLAVVAPAAAYLFDVSAFLDDWMADLAAEQRAADGRVPFVVPDLLKLDQKARGMFPPMESVAIWSDVAAWLPWTLWQAYGDREALTRHFPAMVAHVRRVERLLSARGLWEGGFQFGDWLDPDAPADDAAKAKADKAVVATAAFYRSAAITAAAARVLDDAPTADAMTGLAARLRGAFREHFVYDGGHVVSDCQTVYALAICFGLLDGSERDVAGARLASLVAGSGYRIATGFAGTPFVLDALTDTGHVQSAYRMLLQPEPPGWMYPIRMGATTMWERWDSMLPDGSINPGEMTSFNHYAFGSVADWLHRVVLGIAPGSPGYGDVIIAPRAGGGLSWARGSLRTPRGLVSLSWSRGDGDSITLDVSVPDGMRAIVRLPGEPEHQLAGGQRSFRYTTHVAP
ncbi:alpha-L-rhamnosidase [Cellulomonas sp. KRMCY2]|uniref:alpha-L-rhamnosidase n=1 Tax=Cellulomonas sp. KRMCY2 TaxID=1304865 RepID=UPI0004B849C0|nr:alpha-L-rhamnosidase [Cellulomonas sp. KRMCY2]